MYWLSLMYAQSLTLEGKFHTRLLKSSSVLKYARADCMTSQLVLKQFATYTSVM